jgi:hypothetical protein
LPVVTNPIETTTDAHPEIVGDRTDIFVGEVERIHQLAVDVSLVLIGSGVADTDGRRAHVAFPMRERLLGWERLAVNCENGWERLAGAGMFGGVVLQPIDKAGGFLIKAQTNESVDGEGGVANPGEAVVPVASAADYFGEAGSGGSDDRACGLEGKELEDEGRALDALTPTATIGAVSEPILPKLYGAFEGLFGFTLGGWGGGQRSLAVVLEDESFGLTFFEDEFGSDAALMVALQGHVGGETKIGIVGAEARAAFE